MKLTRGEHWILWYGKYDLGGYNWNEPNFEYEVNIERAKEAEQKAYKELSWNNSLLGSYGYRERRLNISNHESLRTKLKLAQEIK